MTSIALTLMLALWAAPGLAFADRDVRTEHVVNVQLPAPIGMVEYGLHSVPAETFGEGIGMLRDRTGDYSSFNSSTSATMVSPTPTRIMRGGRP